MLSVLLWDVIKKKSGLFLSLVSGNKESILEKSISVRSQWKVEKSIWYKDE